MKGKSADEARFQFCIICGFYLFVNFFRTHGDQSSDQRVYSILMRVEKVDAEIQLNLSLTSSAMYLIPFVLLPCFNSYFHILLENL